MSRISDFAPTCLDELISESGYIEGACEKERVRIRIFSSPTQEFGILSVYMKDGEIILDVEECNEDKN